MHLWLPIAAAYTAFVLLLCLLHLIAAGIVALRESMRERAQQQRLRHALATSLSGWL